MLRAECLTRWLRRTENVLLQLGQVTFEPSQRRQDLLGLIASLGLHEARGDRGREHRQKPIPKSITTMATIRPWTLVGYASPLPTVVTVSIAHLAGEGGRYQVR
jgi:hypothetical protein